MRLLFIAAGVAVSSMGSLLGGLAFIIHAWTVFIAYAASGVIAAVLSLMFPVLSEVYWFTKIGLQSSFADPYCLTIIGYLVFNVVLVLGLFVFQAWFHRRAATHPFSRKPKARL